MMTRTLLFHAPSSNDVLYSSFASVVQLYGTDNGPNLNYGNMATSCDGSFIDDVTEEDKINLLRKGHYYGHAVRAILCCYPIGFSSLVFSHHSLLNNNRI